MPYSNRLAHSRLSFAPLVQILASMRFGPVSGRGATIGAIVLKSVTRYTLRLGHCHMGWSHCTLIWNVPAWVGEPFTSPLLPRVRPGGIGPGTSVTLGGGVPLTENCES